MQFTSLAFVFFLPVVWMLFRILPGFPRLVMLLLASYLFYGFVHPWFVVLLLATTLLDWFTAIRMDEAVDVRRRRAWMLLSVLSNLLVLAAFKYSMFFWNTGLSIESFFSGSSPEYLKNLLIPAGLSFYTFQSMSYTLDVYRKKIAAEKSFVSFALYVSFFPQLVAGPVERYNNLMPQLQKPKRLTTDVVFVATRLLLWGFFKKIAIADRLADFVNPIFAHPENFGGLTLLIGGFFFVVQVYCDFSGYTDIATGVAKFFGVDLMLNWRRPLLSKSLREFWTRNHISMTTWFRDYVYIGLGGSRCSTSRWLFNLFLTFLISGLWHGPAWTFVIWGALHGLVYIIEVLIDRSFGPLRGIRYFGWFYLITFHTLSLIAFRAGSLHDLGIFYERIFSFHWSIATTFSELRQLNDLFPLVLAVGMIGFLFAKELQEEYGLLQRIPFYTTLVRPAFYVMLVVLLFTIGQFSANEFIYFHF